MGRTDVRTDTPTNRDALHLKIPMPTINVNTKQIREDTFSNKKNQSIRDKSSLAHNVNTKHLQTHIKSMHESQKLQVSSK